MRPLARRGSPMQQDTTMDMPSRTNRRAAATQATPTRVVFATPDEGFVAPVAALRKPDFKAVDRLLGPGHQRITDSGDSAADREAALRCVAEFDAKHRIELAGDSDWPMPIPLVRHAAGWAFDADAGDEELIARRIGRNELGAQRLDQVQPLAGPRLAAANVQPRAGKSTPKPCHGDDFRILTAQGGHAPAGPRDDVVGGHLIGGVALLAWPASCPASGVKTFQCNLEGAIDERDLGPDTPAAARKINAFDPAPG